jgi:hypothetical protein
MGWITPITWKAGETVTAAQMNEQVRDNLTFLFQRTAAQTTFDWNSLSPTYPSITSTSWTAISQGDVTLTTAANSRLFIMLSGCAFNLNGNNQYLSIQVDGVNQGDATYGLVHQAYLDNGHPFSMMCVTAPLSAGSHTVGLIARRDTGTHYILQICNTVIEVR